MENYEPENLFDPCMFERHPGILRTRSDANWITGGGDRQPGIGVLRTERRET